MSFFFFFADAENHTVEKSVIQEAAIPILPLPQTARASEIQPSFDKFDSEFEQAVTASVTGSFFILLTELFPFIHIYAALG